MKYLGCLYKLGCKHEGKIVRYMTQEVVVPESQIYCLMGFLHWWVSRRYLDETQTEKCCQKHISILNICLLCISYLFTVLLTGHFCWEWPDLEGWFTQSLGFVVIHDHCMVQCLNASLAILTSRHVELQLLLGYLHSYTAFLWQNTKSTSQSSLCLQRLPPGWLLVLACHVQFTFYPPVIKETKR